MEHYMDTYTKLFGSILDSTIWQEPLPTRVVWITLLAMCDKHGEVSASVPGLARRAGVTLEDCEEAIAKFLGPDKYSRTKEHEGRRIEEIDGGWTLLNHATYREKMSTAERRDYQRKWQADYRERQKAKTNGKTQAEKDTFLDSLVGKPMTTESVLEDMKAFGGEPGDEELTPEERMESNRERIAREEAIQNEVRSKHNPKYSSQ